MRSAAWRITAACLLIAPVGGCASWTKPLVIDGWAADYDTAERLVQSDQRPLLIFFKDTRKSYDEAMNRVLQGGEVKPLLKNYVCCRLFRSHEPDRRYLAQYGVERAPALIVVHLDGTYHALEEPATPESVTRFLSEAKPPGYSPAINHHIPREVRYDWHNDWLSAKRASERREQSIVVVFYRPWTRDWPRLEAVFSRREVHARFSNMVHCRIGRLFGSPTNDMEQFDVKQLPAIVIVHRDGRRNVLELPTSYEAVARFADQDAVPIPAKEPAQAGSVSP